MRAILNYGHTFGHAIENVGEYGEKQFHGQAVAIGMIAAARVGEVGIVSRKATLRIRKLTERAGLPSRIPAGMKADTLMDRMAGDKKVAAGRVRFVIPRPLGGCA